MITDVEVRQEFRQRLPRDFGKRRPARTAWLLLPWLCLMLHLKVSDAVIAGRLPLWYALITLPIAAFTWPYFLFVLHELQHGALLAPGPLRRIASALAAYPILLQPTFWRVVHNHHHAHANGEADHDRRRIAGRHEVGERMFEYEITNPLIVFSLTAAIHVIYYGQMLYFFKGRISFRVSRAVVLAELALGAALFAGLISLIGWKVLLLAWVPYTLAGSALQSLYLISNHLTRPMTDKADALKTGVSVRLFRDWSHLDFGRHVEHHLFPSAPLSELRPVTQLLRDRYSDRFREGTLLGTVRYLISLPGYYLTADVLTDRNGRRRVRID